MNQQVKIEPYTYQRDAQIISVINSEQGRNYKKSQWQQNKYGKHLNLFNLSFNLYFRLKQYILVNLQLLHTLMNECQLPIITLQSINRKVKFQHRLEESKKIKFITWHEIIDIIELYEPTADLKKIIIQAKPLNNWQYLTNQFIASLKDCCNPFHIRYKIYQKVNFNPSTSEKIENSIKSCEQKLAYYEDKYDIHKMDINIFWASPVRNQERKNVINWGLCPDYINQVCQVLKTYKKKAFLQINLFNSDCFKRDEYSIVYLICHVECQTKTGVIKEYMMGQKREGKCGRLSPQLINDKLRDKKIELLIFHSSCSNYHIEAIKNCKGIKNIISINASPIYRSDRVRFFLQRFFTKLINCMTIKNSYDQSVKELDEKFPNDRMCCCYHQHTNIDCPFHQYRANFKQFTYEHYNLHKRKANQNLCCICFLQANQVVDLKQKHRLERKYEIVKVSDDFNDKKFQFQEGELKGDVFLLNCFKTAEGILGNRHILNELIYTFQKQSNKKYKIFNIYNKMCQDKQIFIVSHVNFLMRRKILTRSIRIQKLQKLNKQNIELDPKLIYTYYCQSISDDQLKKISKLQINILIVSQQKIEFDDFNLDLSINAECGSADIRPFNSKECCNYVKADRHLTEDLKTKVANFFQYVYKQQFRFIYYPTNFDYMSLMEQISKSVYEPANQVQQFESIVQKLQQEKLLQQYIILMTIFNQQELISNKKVHQLVLFKRILFWYSKITQKQTESIVDVIKFNIKYFHLVYQISFKYIILFLLDILKLFNRIATIPQEKKQSFQKKGMGLYEATTLSKNSLISIFLKQEIESCRTINIPSQLYQVLTENVSEDKIKSILNFTKRVLESFYLYDSLEEDKQIYKAKKSKRNYVPKPQNLEKQQQIKMQNQSMKRKQMEMERNAKKVEPSNNKKYEVLKYCTLILNNAIIFRRNNKDIASLDDEQDREEYSIQNLAQYRKITSLSPQIKNNQWENIEDAEDNQIDANVYTQQHFIRKQASLSRYSLLDILAKVIKKRPFSKTSIINHSLSIQLLLQIFFTDFNEDESLYDIDMLKREMVQIEAIINRIVDISEIGKVRYLFDSMMLQLLMGTKCFRQKITSKIFQSVENRCKKLVVYGNFKTRKSFIHNFLIQISSIFKNLSSDDEIYQKLKTYLEIYDSTIRSYEGQKLANKIIEIINNWSLFKDSIGKINSVCSVHQRNTAYHKIYELKTHTQKQIKQQERGKIWIDRNTYKLLRDLDGKLSTILIQMNSRLLVLFFCETPEKQKFFINHDRILSRDFESPQSSTNINQVGLFNNNRFQPIIRMKLQFNEKNLRIVSQRGGCKYLILQASNQMELLQRLKKKDNFQVSIQDLRTRLTKLAFSYLFLCLYQGDKLYSLLRHENKELKVTQFNLKSVYVAEEVKSALMVNLSVFMSNKIHLDNKQLVREGSSPSIKSQSQLRARQSIQMHYKGKPKESTQIIKQVRSLLSTSLNKDELEYIFESEHKAYQIWLNQDLIIQKYYTAIKSIYNSLQPNFKRNYEIKKSSKFEQLNLQVFIECFQIYMKHKYKNQNNNSKYEEYENDENYNNNQNQNQNQNQNSSIQFFVFQDEDSKTSYPNKQYTRLFQQILSDRHDRFFNTYQSHRKMLVILKNLTPHNKTSWMNEVIKNLLLCDQKNSKANYVQIQKIPCLIVVLGDKDSLKGGPDE